MDINKRSYLVFTTAQKFVIQGNTQKSLKILLFSQAMCEHVEPLAA